MENRGRGAFTIARIKFLENLADFAHAMFNRLDGSPVVGLGLSKSFLFERGFPTFEFHVAVTSALRNSDEGLGGVAGGLSSSHMKSPLKTHSRFLPLKTSPTREF
jgi:hypothetical protein